MVQPDEEILKIDLGSNKFCELIVGKLNAVLPHKVIEVGKISNQIERESLGAQV